MKYNSNIKYPKYNVNYNFFLYGKRRHSSNSLVMPNDQVSPAPDSNKYITVLSCIIKNRYISLP